MKKVYVMLFAISPFSGVIAMEQGAPGPGQRAIELMTDQATAVGTIQTHIREIETRIEKERREPKMRWRDSRSSGRESKRCGRKPITMYG